MNLYENELYIYAMNGLMYIFAIQHFSWLMTSLWTLNAQFGCY